MRPCLGAAMVDLKLEDDYYFEQTLHRPLRLLFEGGFDPGAFIGAMV